MSERVTFGRVLLTAYQLGRFSPGQRVRAESNRFMHNDYEEEFMLCPTVGRYPIKALKIVFVALQALNF